MNSKQTVFIRTLGLPCHVQDVNISIASAIFGSAKRIKVAALVVVVVLVLREHQSSFCSARCARASWVLSPSQHILELNLILALAACISRGGCR
jgi:hypothetical protein